MNIEIASAAMAGCFVAGIIVEYFRARNMIAGAIREVEAANKSTEAALAEFNRRRGVDRRAS